MLNGFGRWSDFSQGIVYMIAGSTVLLYALGFMQKGITLVIVMCASALIAIGCVKIGLYGKVASMLHHMKRHR